MKYAYLIGGPRDLSKVAIADIQPFIVFLEPFPSSITSSLATEKKDYEKAAIKSVCYRHRGAVDENRIIYVFDGLAHEY